MSDLPKEDRIEQDIIDHPTSPSLSKVMTIVWYKREIARVWYDDLIPANDSAIKARKKEAEGYLIWIKQLDMP